MKNIFIVVETLILVAVIFLLGRCSHIKINDLEHNIMTYKSQIETVETKNGELLTYMNSLILNEVQAREELEMTKQEYKDLEKKLNDKISYISNLESQLNHKDTIFLKADTVYIKNNNIFKKFTWMDEWSTIDATVSGLTIEDSKLSITSLNTKIPIEVGLTNDYKIWVRSNNPNVEFTNITGSVIQNSSLDNNKRRFHHGLSAGFGIHYGMFGKTWDFGPQFGYSLQYTF